jgi:hypothetical protein
MRITNQALRLVFAKISHSLTLAWDFNIIGVQMAHTNVLLRYQLNMMFCCWFSVQKSSKKFILKGESSITERLAIEACLVYDVKAIIRGNVAEGTWFHNGV